MSDRMRETAVLVLFTAGEVTIFFSFRCKVNFFCLNVEKTPSIYRTILPYPNFTKKLEKNPPNLVENLNFIRRSNSKIIN